jgi:hypothetical protein
MRTWFRSQSCPMAQDLRDSCLTRGEVERIMALRTKNPFLSKEENGIVVKQRRAIPHEFVLDAIASLSPWTRPMFGCLAVYIEEKIVLALRDKQEHRADNGVWLATTQKHHESLRREFPNMRSIRLLGKRVTGWQVLPTDAADFEEASLRACELIVAGDPRIGKLPGTRRARRPKSGKQQKASRGAKEAKRTARKRATT